MHIEPTIRSRMGNIAFMGPHAGMATSRRDDMYSLLYVLLYISLGRLPFPDISSNRKIARFKREASPKVLCKDAPKFIPLA